MIELLAAVAVFLLTHLLPAVRPLREAAVRLAGERIYIIFFSLLSVAVIIWLGWAYARAPYIELWPQTPWSRWVPLTAMAAACPLAAIGLTSPNVFSLGAGRARFDPARPGIVALVRHPVIWALVLWSAAHIPPNGDAASLILFGLLTVLGLTGPLTLDRRRRRAMGESVWTDTAARVAETGWGTAVLQIGPWRIIGAGILYGVLLYTHEGVIGASPFPL